MTLASTQASGESMPPRLTTTLNHREFKDALGRVARIIPNRSANPGLTLVQIAFTPGAITLTGSSNDSSMQVRIPSDTQTEGSFAVPSAPLTQIINSIASDTIELASDGTTLHITGGSFKTRLQLYPRDQVMRITFPESLPGSMQAEDLTRLLENTRYAAAAADFQATFRGVNLEFKTHRTRAVATDGFRLAYYDAPPTHGLETTILVNAKNTIEITRAFNQGPVRIGVENNKLALENDTTKLTVNLMDGQFPDYERVIPAMFHATINLQANELIDSLARVALLAEGGANHRVDAHLRGGLLTLTGEGQYGSAKEELSVRQSGHAEELLLAVNAKYLTEALKPVDGPVTLNLNPGSAPMTVKNDGDDKYLAMVVPLRTS